MVNSKNSIRNYFLKEEAPANAAGSGAIAGIGVGPDGEPGVPVSKQFSYANNIMDYLMNKDEEDQEDPITLKRSDRFHNMTLADQQNIIMAKLMRR
tara:strand:+ start:222 stop:509 length:288 start_codon:yes stop_codon:yes gene_type:complete